MAEKTRIHLEDDPLWFKDAIIYEAHVRAFFDTSADGMGDFRGLAQKLDYLQDLGVTAIWLLPFFPSPWKDDGYDISDYTDVHPAYGTLRDFQMFLKEAHRRGLRVITEVVMNHTSDQHPWFQRARRAPPGSKWRDFYVWSDTADKYKDARIIFQDFETSNWTWDAVAKAYYWHRFYSHQPDLNFDSPHVRQAIKEVIDFWFDMGVDAFRLDAIPYLYERPNTNCENLAETHSYLKELRAHVDSKYKNRMLLAEANQWPDDAVAYFGDGDECHMAFHFPLMPRLFMANRMEDRYPITEILEHTPSIPDNCQWAMFLRNHDELTLEMVTDEERDYMYRVYAQDRQMRVNLGIRRRLAPLLGNDRRKIELMNALLFSLPGTPVIYYGDEIGMGDNIYLGDRNGVRTPMQWSADRNAGFSRSSPQKLYLPITSDPEYHYEAVNVDAQLNNPNSLLWWMKRIVQQRKQFKAFGRGTLEFLHPENRKVLAFYRRFEGETILVVANLSRFPQNAELDLSAVKGMVPVEMFGSTEFPQIGNVLYNITLGGHGFYWFSLQPQPQRRESIEVEGGPVCVPTIEISDWDRVLTDRSLSAFRKILPAFLKSRRWYRAKARSIRAVEVRDTIAIPDSDSYIVVVRVDYPDGDPEDYVLLVSYAKSEGSERIEGQHPDTVIAKLRGPGETYGVLYNALWNPAFSQALLGAIARRRRIRGRAGEITATHTREFRRIWGGKHVNLEPAVSKAEQSNSSIIYGDRFILKLFRKVEPGANPDVEISGFLTEKGYLYTPPLAGSIEYRPNDGELLTLGILQAYVPHEGDAWQYTLDELSRYFEHVLASGNLDRVQASAGQHPLALLEQSLPSHVGEYIGTYLESARLLGVRTAQMHRTLTDPNAGPDFAPQPYTDHYRQGLYHGMLSQVTRSFQLLRQRLPQLNEAAAAGARQVLELEQNVRKRFAHLKTHRINTVRIRHHGDFHLGQVLYTGRDFIIIDFEGEPARPLSERRLKRSPLRDVAGMIRSFQYAAYAALFGQISGISPRPEDMPLLETWAAYWTSWVSAVYLRGYLDEAQNAAFVPANPEEFRILLDAFMLEKAVYEIGYELNNRPDWVRIPLRGIVHLVT
jgi:maltose alpha-D-glucosyltransferase/alpha-amylase